jgi:hypothetical protein
MDRRAHHRPDAIVIDCQGLAVHAVHPQALPRLTDGYTAVALIELIIVFATAH